jgi:hypothetical protein
MSLPTGSPGRAELPGPLQHALRARLAGELADALAYWALDPGKKEEDFQVEPRFGTLKLHEGALKTLLRRRERVLHMVEAFS